MALCANGDWLAVFYGGPSHTGPSGNLYASRSTDGGATWSAPSAIRNVSADCRDPALARLSDDTLVLSFTETDGSTTWQARTMRSTDNGATWADPVDVPVGASMSWNFCSAPVAELPDGTCLLGSYVSDTTASGPLGIACQVAKSTDGCQTWSYLATIADSDDGDRTWEEPNIVLLADQSTIACLLRSDTDLTGPTNDYLIHAKFSTVADPSTWTGLKFLWVGSGRPAAALTPGGDVLVMYRNKGANASAFYYRAADSTFSHFGAEVNLGGDPDPMIYGEWAQDDDGQVVAIFAIEEPGNVYFERLDTGTGTVWVPVTPT